MHCIERMHYAAGFAVLALALGGCGSSKDPPARTSPTSPATAPAAAPQQVPVVGKPPADIWVPAEHKMGMKRFKDPGVYVDGVPIGMLKFGELPVPLAPLWHEEEASVPFKPGDEVRTKIVRQRRYRFVDYLRAMGVDVAKIKQLHLYGGAKRRVAVIVDGKDLRARPDGLTFRFGSDVFGKPIPACAKGMADGNCPDNINAVTVYIERTPPTRKGGYFYLGDTKLYDIPYFGEPLRGGVRVYLDGPMVAYIKRHKLYTARNESFKVTRADGSTHWKLFAFLRAQGVSTDSIQEGWLVQKNKRIARLGRKQLREATFQAVAKKSGVILFGPERIPTNSIALHSKPVNPKDLPVIRPHEHHD